MKSIDLSSLSLAELIKIEKKLPRAIVKARKSEKVALRKKMEAIAAESGFALHDLFDGNNNKTKRIVKPKYKNPDNIEETWTGRGRKPRWVQSHLSNGGSLDDVTI